MTGSVRLIMIGLAISSLLLLALVAGCIAPRGEAEPVSPADNSVAIPPIDAQAPAITETATFAMGCFWGPEARFGVTPGVVRTRVGYAGGTKENPTYRNLGDHAETVQIDYDPTRISYEQLLDIFWSSHHPEVRYWTQHYTSIIFYHNEEQKRLAMETREREEAKLGEVYTEVVPFSRFYLAEDYHQKYHLQLTFGIMKDFDAIYPKIEDFINSTAAARVNGYLSGYGTLESLKEEIDSFGLSPLANEALLDFVSASVTNQ